MKPISEFEAMQLIGTPCLTVANSKGVGKAYMTELAEAYRKMLSCCLEKQATDIVGKTKCLRS